MKETLYFDDFRAIFLTNVNRRSRTAKGISDTSTSSTKQSLLKTGEALTLQVKENTEKLIRSVWDYRKTTPITPECIHLLDEEWNDIVNQSLLPADAYEKEYRTIKRNAKRKEKETEVSHPTNYRYRVWDVHYSTLKLPPIEIGLVMEKFYATLTHKIEQCRKELLNKADLLAYADFTIDKAIHPWREGCGRSATAIVMWLSLLTPDITLPLFGPRERHHNAMESLSMHTLYFLACLTHDYK